MPKTFLFCFYAIFFVWQNTLVAQPISQVQKGIVNEAFIQKTGGTILLDSIDKQPPEPIQEKIPAYSDPQRVWIPGYWQWDNISNDFVWVSGTLRRPPPGHQWISGFWFPFENSWVRIPGFWSPVSLEYINYINQPPPDPINENIPESPGEDYFWAPGYWEFSYENHQFTWIMGKWIPFDQNWVYVPAHYIWHPQGFIFIAPYWDWNVIDRGDAYATVFIEPEVRAKIIYEPAVILEIPILAEMLFPCYPDYLCFFHHWLHFQPQFWDDFCCVPPWWNWHSWWGLAWHDQWSLWWWYTHPGYPNPQWISPTLTAAIPPPSQQLLSIVKSTQPPPIVTPKGVVTQNTLLQSIVSTTKAKAPILPANTKKRTEILETATTQLKQPATFLKPTGSIKKFDEIQPSFPKIAMEPGSTSREPGKKGTFRPMELPKKPTAPRITPSKIEVQKIEDKTTPTVTPPLKKKSPIQTPPTPRRIAPVKTPQEIQVLETPVIPPTTTVPVPVPQQPVQTAPVLVPQKTVPAPVTVPVPQPVPTAPVLVPQKTVPRPVPVPVPQQPVQTAPVLVPQKTVPTPVPVPQTVPTAPVIVPQPVQTAPVLVPQKTVPTPVPVPVPQNVPTVPVPQQQVVQPKASGPIMNQLREQYQHQIDQTQIQNQLIQEQEKRKMQDIESPIK